MESDGGCGPMGGHPVPFPVWLPSKMDAATPPPRPPGARWCAGGVPGFYPLGTKFFQGYPPRGDGILRGRGYCQLIINIAATRVCGVDGSHVVNSVLVHRSLPPLCMDACMGVSSILAPPIGFLLCLWCFDPPPPHPVGVRGWGPSLCSLQPKFGRGFPPFLDGVHGGVSLSGGTRPVGVRILGELWRWWINFHQGFPPIGHSVEC